MTPGRRQCTGSSGRSAAMYWSTVGRRTIPATAWRRSGETAARGWARGRAKGRATTDIAGLLANIRARGEAPMTKRRGKPEPARDFAAGSGQTMLVVLRIALVRTDIGVFLNDPGPRLAGSIEKDAFTSLLCSSPDRSG